MARELRTKPTRTLPLPEAVFSVDVEDWFHILDTPAVPDESMWDSLPSLVEANVYRLLDLFSEKRAQVTCFFLGWVAKRFPHLVRETLSRGHEIASHGYAHRLVYSMTATEFYEDALRSRLLLEDTAGCAVYGYRCAGFSTTEQTPWFFEKLALAGYRYDSSVFPARRGHGGMPNAYRAPHVVEECGHNCKLLEFPISIADVCGKSMCFFGGGYLRLFPYWLIRKMTEQVLNAGRPVVFYVHPREIDPNHPRLPMNVSKRFKCYVNVETTQAKIRHILDDFAVTTFQNFLLRHVGNAATVQPDEFWAQCQQWRSAA